MIENEDKSYSSDYLKIAEEEESVISWLVCVSKEICEQNGAE